LPTGFNVCTEFWSELILFLIEKECETLFPMLLEAVTFTKPLADLWKRTVDEVLLDTGTMLPGNCKDG
jgi:hypothetical protein